VGMQIPFLTDLVGLPWEVQRLSDKMVQRKLHNTPSEDIEPSAWISTLMVGIG
jgi:hypothetical protein